MSSWNEMRQVLDRVNERIRQHGWDSVTQPERDAANVDALYGCVLNGGIDALFFNARYLGDTVGELVSSLERTGALRAAALLREAVALFPSGRVPATLDSRVQWLKGLQDSDPFAGITRRFYDEAEKEERVLLGFFRRHPRLFNIARE